MKLKLQIIALASLFFIGTSCRLNPVEINATVLQVTNANQSDTVLVYLTLNGSEGYVNDVNGIFGIVSDNKLQGSFYLAPNDTLSYTAPAYMGISGNISFWNPPLNCPYPAPTLYEFTLNNDSTGVNAQETVDISCVAGVTTIGSIAMSGGENWTDNSGNDSVVSIQNKSVYQNFGISGVFPYGCTNCVNTDGAPDCEGHPQYAVPNVKNLCNVQRNAVNNGGIVCISYIGMSQN